MRVRRRSFLGVLGGALLVASLRVWPSLCGQGTELRYAPQPVGMLWWDTTYEDAVLKRWDGRTWEPVATVRPPILGAKA
jgi:hypothetical protein